MTAPRHLALERARASDVVGVAVRVEGEREAEAVLAEDGKVAIDLRGAQRADASGKRGCSFWEAGL